MTEPTIVYTWLIEQLDAAPAEGELTNVIRKIHWRLLAGDGSSEVDAFGDVSLANADPADFTPYENLTAEIVIGWLEAAIDAKAESSDGPSVAQLRASLAGTLNYRRASPVVPLPVPWG